MIQRTRQIERFAIRRRAGAIADARLSAIRPIGQSVERDVLRAACGSATCTIRCRKKSWGWLDPVSGDRQGEFVDQRKLGKVYSNGIRLRVRSRKLRLPDVIFLHRDHFHARHNRAWDGADLVMEVVSESPADRQRDYERNLIDYAEAKVSEYWIIDPERQAVIVHQLAGDQYSVQGEYGRASRHFRAVGRFRR